MLILSVKFIIKLWMCIKLNDHYNVTYSESITCHRFRIALIRLNSNLPTAVTNDRLAIVIVRLLVAKLITVLF